MLANALLAWSTVFRNTQSENRGAGCLVPEHARVVLRPAVVFRNKARLLLPSAARVPVRFAPLLWALISNRITPGYFLKEGSNIYRVGQNVFWGLLSGLNFSDFRYDKFWDPDRNGCAAELPDE